MPDRFATILTCIDGRIQRPLDEWIKGHLAVDYVDTITEPGPDSLISTANEEGLATVVDKVRISQHAHGSATLVIAGHSDCAGNPVSDGKHQDQLRHAMARLAGSLPGTRILAVHARQCGQDCWSPQLLAEVMPLEPAAVATAAGDTPPAGRGGH